MARIDDTADLPLIHADAWLLAIDKPAGLLVHRTALDAQADDDVVTRLQAALGAPVWPVHRLDKGTSGVLLLARDVDTARALGALFAAGSLDKRYLALVRGWPADAGVSRQTSGPKAVPSFRSESIIRNVVGNQIGPRQLELPPLSFVSDSAGS